MNSISPSDLWIVGILGLITGLIIGFVIAEFVAHLRVWIRARRFNALLQKTTLFKFRL